MTIWPRFVLTIKYKKTINTIKAKVTNWLQVKTRFGPRLVLNTTRLDNGAEATVWSQDLNNQIIKRQSKGKIVELIEGEDGYSLLDLDDTDNLVEEALDEYATNIEFPPAYTPSDMVEIEKLARERAKVLITCIDAVQNELEARHLEIYERTARSLGVTLFIQISRYLP
jgi:hypothetical protein